MDALAYVLAAEDARRWDGDLFQSASNHTDPVVRRHAALALGRIRDPAGVPILLELLTDPDSVVQQDAAFALGLIADPTALQHLQDVLLQSTDAERTDADAEIVTAIAKIGGPDAARLFDELLVRWMSRTDAGDAPFLVEPLLGEAWRLGEDAPVVTIAQLADAPSERVRRAAVYSLSRLRAAGAARELLAASADEDALVREWAARALTRAFADAAGLDHSAVATRLSQLAADPERGVRVNALRALGTFANRAEHGYVAIEGRVRDGETGEIVVMFADRETAKMRILDIQSLHWYGHAFEIFDEWAAQLVEVANRPLEPGIADSAVFTLYPW